MDNRAVLAAHAELTEEELEQKFPITPPDLSIAETLLYNEFDDLVSRCGTAGLSYQEVDCWMRFKEAEDWQADLMIRLDVVLRRAKFEFEREQQ